MAQDDRRLAEALRAGDADEVFRERVAQRLAGLREEERDERDGEPTDGGRARERLGTPRVVDAAGKSEVETATANAASGGRWRSGRAATRLSASLARSHKLRGRRAACMPSASATAHASASASAASSSVRKRRGQMIVETGAWKWKEWPMRPRAKSVSQSA